MSERMMSEGLATTGRRCAVCGAVIPADALFCGACGSATPRTQTALDMPTIPGAVDAVSPRHFSLANLSQPSYRRAMLASTGIVLSLVPGYFLFMSLFPSGGTVVGARALQSASGKLLAGDIEYLHLITATVAVVSLVSLYWFALLRVRRVALIRAWLEIASLDVVLLTVGVYGLASFLSLAGIDTTNGQTHPFWWGETLNAFPDLAPRAVALALIVATTSTAFAAVFASWAVLRKTGVVAVPRGGEYLLVLASGVAAVAFLLVGVPTLILRIVQALVGSELFNGATALGNHVGEALALIVLWILVPVIVIVALATRSALGVVHQAEQVLPGTSAEPHEQLPLDPSQTLPDGSRTLSRTVSTSVRWQPTRASRRGAKMSGIGGIISLIGYLLPWAVLSVLLMESSCSGRNVTQTRSMAPSGADLAYQSASSFMTALSLALVATEICLLAGGLLALGRRPTARWAGTLLGAAIVGLCIALYQAYLLASARFPMTHAIRMTFLGFGMGFWLTLSGLLLGIAGASLLLAAARRRG